MTPNIRRCYDGCFDSDTQKEVDMADKLLNKIRKFVPDVHITFFPVEQQWVVHIWGKEISSYHYSKNAALIEAWTNLSRSLKHGLHEPR